MCGGGPVLNGNPRQPYVLILSTLLFITLFIFPLRGLLLPPFMFIGFRKGAYGGSEGGGNKGGRLGV